MNTFFKVVLALGAFLCLSASYARNNDHPTTFLGPTLRGTYTDLINPCTAYSIAGEAGLKNFRVGGTLGWEFAQRQRLKVSAEYLWQRITYSFFTGNTDEWVQQGAIGGLYQYRFCNVCWDPTIDIRAWYSYAPSKSLSTRTGLVTRNGILLTFADQRRIAGSNAGGIAPGITFHPWGTTVFGLDLNWDDVQYDKQRHRSQEDAKGFGGTAKVSQMITDDIMLDLSAAIRQPFNNYAASLNWLNVNFYGNWALGLIGDYTAGKNTLPSTWDVGITANYFPDHTCDSECIRRAAARFTNLSCSDNFLAWTSDPAVYLPQVLAIPDEDVIIPDPRCSATPPTLTGVPLPDVLLAASGSATVNGATAFSPSSGLTYTVNVTPVPAPGNSVTINPSTGVVTVNFAGPNQNLNVTVTAINVCGAAVSSSFIAVLTRIG